MLLSIYLYAAVYVLLRFVSDPSGGLNDVKLLSCLCFSSSNLSWVHKAETETETKTEAKTKTKTKSRRRLRRRRRNVYVWLRRRRRLQLECHLKLSRQFTIGQVSGSKWFLANLSSKSIIVIIITIIIIRTIIWSNQIRWDEVATIKLDLGDQHCLIQVGSSIQLANKGRATWTSLRSTKPQRKPDKSGISELNCNRCH